MIGRHSPWRKPTWREALHTLGALAGIVLGIALCAGCGTVLGYLGAAIGLR